MQSEKFDKYYIIEKIVEEGFRLYDESHEQDRDLVRSIYSVWCDLSCELGKVLRDSRPNIVGGRRF